MSDFGTMKSRIADELIRDDLSSQIEKAILSAVKFYSRKRFWFSEAQATTSTSDGKEYYQLPDNFREMDSMIVTVNDRDYPLTPRTFDYLEDIVWGGTTFTGYPEDYAIYAKQFRLYPIPNGDYQLTLSYLKSFDDLSDNTDTNAFMTEGEELIRSRAKADLFINVLYDVQMGTLMKQLEKEQYDALIAASTQYTSTRTLRPTRF